MKHEKPTVRWEVDGGDLCLFCGTFTIAVIGPFGGGVWLCEIAGLDSTKHSDRQAAVDRVQDVVGIANIEVWP